MDRRGKIVLNPQALPQHTDGQRLLDAQQFELLRPFEITRELRGPDLVAPRPRLRIVLGELSGAPHVHWTRSRPRLWRRSRVVDCRATGIVALDPAIETADVREAVDLERDLQPDLVIAA